MKEFNVKPKTLKAIQWNKHGDCDLVSPVNFTFGNPGLGDKCSKCGKQAKDHGHVRGASPAWKGTGLRETACPGDWIVVTGNYFKDRHNSIGDIQVTIFSDEQFNEIFEAVT